MQEALSNAFVYLPTHALQLVHLVSLFNPCCMMQSLSWLLFLYDRYATRNIDFNDGCVRVYIGGGPGAV